MTLFLIYLYTYLYEPNKVALYTYNATVIWGCLLNNLSLLARVYYKECLSKRVSIIGVSLIGRTIIRVSILGGVLTVGIHLFSNNCLIFQLDSLI